MLEIDQASRPIVIALLFGILMSFSSSSAWSQAGSTGGTIGKQDKSLSGGDEESAPRPNTRAAKPAPAKARPSGDTDCHRIVGTWKSDYNGVVLVFAQDGTAVTNGGTEGPNFTWTCSGGVARDNSDLNSDTYAVSPDGNTLTIAIVWKPPSGRSGESKVTAHRIR
jgi:hypothetical protein